LYYFGVVDVDVGFGEYYGGGVGGVCGLDDCFGVFWVVDVCEYCY